MNPATIPVESASSENANDEIDEAIEFDEEENMIVVGTGMEDTTQNNGGEDGVQLPCRFRYVLP